MANVFTEDDYNSNDGMLTSVWGPPLWHTLHTISFNYPVHPTPEDKQHYAEFIYSLRYTLPCGKCRANLPMNLEKCPLTLRSMRNRESFSRWVYRLHEQINKMLGKKSGLSYDDVRDRYENFRARCSLKGMSNTHIGCSEPIVGVKSKCVLSIIPNSIECDTFNMDERCQARFAEQKCHRRS